MLPIKTYKTGSFCKYQRFQNLQKLSYTQCLLIAFERMLVSINDQYGSLIMVYGGPVGICD